jgi:hypothetical protein
MIDTRENAATDKIMTGAQVKDQDARYQAGIALAIEKMKLRQWAVEQAVKVACDDQSFDSKTDIQELVKYFYNFVTTQEK